MGLKTYVARRILLLIPVLIGVTSLIFLISMCFTPEQRAALYVTDRRQMRDLKGVAERYHLYDPINVQYVNWLKKLLQGDLGWSSYSHMPVTRCIIEYVPATLELALYAGPITIFLGIWLGKECAVHKDRLVDHISRVFAIIGWSLPTFWSAILFLSVFYGGLRWIPPGRLGEGASWYVSHSTDFIRYTNINTIDALLNWKPWIFLDALKHLVLPVTNLVIVSCALIMRIMRSSMLEVLGKGYITMARAKGLDETDVINKHAQRNALIPVTTISGVMLAGMMCGMVITETVFNYMGIGYWAANAATHLDIAGILGFALIVGVVYVTANLIVDIMYAYLDPRIRLG